MPNTGLQVSGQGVSITGDILNAGAREFVAGLVRAFGERRLALLDARREAQAAWDAGSRPAFPAFPDDDWRAEPAPEALRDRRVEIVVPAQPGPFGKALGAGANGVVADFEDGLSPTWPNLMAGQQALREYWRGPAARSGPQLTARVRGWHLEDRHVEMDGRRVPAALLDAGMYLFHNLGPAREAGRPLHLCIPKLEGAGEAALWADVLHHSCDVLNVPAGAVKCSVVIETLPAIFRVDELLAELRDFVAGVHAGRWDYLFSFIKTLRSRPDGVLGDRAGLTATEPFVAAYLRRLVDSAHRRGVHAIGGNGTFVPMEVDAEADRTARARVRQEKVREVTLGFDGTWVAHPGLVGVAREAFEEHLPHPNQLYRVFKDSRVTASDLLEVAAPVVSLDGLRSNIRAAVRYLAAWLAGEGSVVIDNQLEHIGTAEIARSQLWQWLHRNTSLAGGGTLTPALFDELLAEETAAAASRGGLPPLDYKRASALLGELVKADGFADFLTDTAYEELP